MVGYAGFIAPDEGIIYCYIPPMLPLFLPLVLGDAVTGNSFIYIIYFSLSIGVYILILKYIGKKFHLINPKKTEFKKTLKELSFLTIKIYLYGVLGGFAANVIWSLGFWTNIDGFINAFISSFIQPIYYTWVLFLLIYITNYLNRIKINFKIYFFLSFISVFAISIYTFWDAYMDVRFDGDELYGAGFLTAIISYLIHSGILIFGKLKKIS